MRCLTIYPVDGNSNEFDRMLLNGGEAGVRPFYDHFFQDAEEVWDDVDEEWVYYDVEITRLSTGADVRFDFKLIEDMQLNENETIDWLRIIAPEEFIHMAQYQFYTAINGFFRMNNPPQGNIEFEAKVLVGVINSQNQYISSSEYFTNECGKNILVQGYNEEEYQSYYEYWISDPNTPTQYVYMEFHEEIAPELLIKLTRN